MITQLRNIIAAPTVQNAITLAVLRRNFSSSSSLIQNLLNKNNMLQIQASSSLSQKSTFSMASFKEKMEKKQKEKSEDEFKKEIEFLANKPSFTLVDFKQRILDQLTKMKKGLRAKLLSGQQENEAMLTKQKVLLNALTDEELLQPEKIGQTEKKQIAMIAQCEIEDVNKLISGFENLKQAHNFLRRTKEKGQPLPESSEELQWKFRQERDISYAFKKQMQDKTHGRSKKQYRKIQKWSKKLHL